MENLEKLLEKTPCVSIYRDKMERFGKYMITNSPMPYIRVGGNTLEEACNKALSAYEAINNE